MKGLLFLDCCGEEEAAFDLVVDLSSRTSFMDVCLHNSGQDSSRKSPRACVLGAVA